MRMRAIFLTGLLLISIGAAQAADPRYPDWPCVQAKVPEISLAAVWAGPPIDDVANAWKDDPEIAALVEQLAARRVPVEQAQKSVTAFLARSPDKAKAGRLIFAGLFDNLNAQRSTVLNGLERVTRKQREAVEKIRADSAALQSLQASPTPDQAKLDELNNQVLWEARIFEDRRRVVAFVCEVPTIIDQRLFALGRVIQQEME
ncbi:hypothetical protein [Tardiphaga sp.]|jgi:hypothetical protein|uniref:hypothetical protein n=1 Tax=Tardiphaga sp. TaxID=1926292 RepID=UPI0037DA0B9E